MSRPSRSHASGTAPTRLAGFRLLSLAMVAATMGTAQAVDEPADSLMARLATEEVEPGVLRVLSDGYRELSRDREDTQVYEYWSQFRRTHSYRLIEAAPDGSVWVMDDGRFFSIGNEETYDLEHQPRVAATDDIEVAPDGRLWRVAVFRPTLRSFDGRRWTRYRQKQQFCGIEIQPDGTPWAMWGPYPGTGNGGCIVETLGRWNGKRWKVFDIPELQPSYGSQFAVTGNDEVWLCCADKAWAAQQRLVRFNGRRFKVIDDPAPQQSKRNDAPCSSMGWTSEEGGFLRAAPDGSVWVTTSEMSGSKDVAPACDGLAHFDGTTWARYLLETCIYAIDIAPDGTAWLQAANVGDNVLNDVQQGRPVEPVQTYVIHPEAAAATE